MQSIIQDKLSHSGINELHGENETSNSSGDIQKKLDVISNGIKTEECSVKMTKSF